MRVKRLLNFAVVLAISACDGTATSSGPQMRLELAEQLPDEVFVGTVVPLAILVLDNAGEPQPAQTITWTVMSGGGAVAPTQSATNDRGIALTNWSVGAQPSKQSIQAQAGEASLLINVQVTSPTVDSVRIIPDSLQFHALADSIQVSATAFRDHSPIASLDITWTSSDATIVRVDESGTIWSVRPGVAFVYARAEGAADTVVARVSQLVDSIVMVFDSLNLIIGDTVLYAAHAFDANGYPILKPLIEWSESAPVVLYLDEYAGIARARAVGETTVKATAGRDSASSRVRVAPRSARFVSVDAGVALTCAVTIEQSLYCWGWTLEGPPPPPLIGFRSSEAYAPTPVRTTAAVVAVRAGGQHACLLTSDGHPQCLLSNLFGELGDGTNVPRSAPAPVVGNFIFSAVASGFGHSCGLVANGDTFCWGNNAYGSLGDGSSSNNRLSPTRVATDIHFVKVDAHWNSTCALDANGTAFCWGLNNRGQLGFPPTQQCHDTFAIGAAVPCSSTPGAVVTALRFSEITVGGEHTCALTAADEVYCWGNGEQGSLGRGDTTSSPVPAAIDGALRFSQLSAGGEHTCGLSNGIAYCWGGNSYGQAGPETGARCASGSCVLSPSPIDNTRRFTSISAGARHTCATSDDGVYCWGSNGFGQLGTGDNNPLKTNAPAKVIGTY